MKNPVYLDVKKFFSGKTHIDHELADAYAQHLLAIAIDNGEFRMRHSASWDFMREAIQKIQGHNNNEPTGFYAKKKKCKIAVICQ